MADSASSDREARRYFSSWTDENGLVHCGARRKRCRGCQYQYTLADRLLFSCPQCGLDRRCQNRIGRGKKRCRSHERSHLRMESELHPRARGGYLKAFEAAGGNLADRFVRAYESLNMRSVKAEAALLQSRAEQVAAQLTSNQASAAWLRMVAAVQQIERLQPRVAAGDKAAQRAYGSLVAGILDDIRSGARESELWEEAMLLAERVAVMKQREAGIEQSRKSFLTAGEAMALCSVLSMATIDSLGEVRSVVESHVAAVTDRAAYDGVVRTALEAGADPVDAVWSWLQGTKPDGLLAAFIPARKRFVERIAAVTGNGKPRGDGSA